MARIRQRQNSVLRCRLMHAESAKAVRAWCSRRYELIFKKLVALRA